MEAVGKHGFRRDSMPGAVCRRFIEDSAYNADTQNELVAATGFKSNLF
jgi:hypothetical protein